jgi:hypothetical protein
MSQEFVNAMILKMNIELNQLIEKNNYDLTSPEVLRYSRRLDRMILLYDRLSRKKPESQAPCTRVGERG